MDERDAASMAVASADGAVKRLRPRSSSSAADLFASSRAREREAEDDDASMAVAFADGAVARLRSRNSSSDAEAFASSSASMAREH